MLHLAERVLRLSPLDYGQTVVLLEVIGQVGQELLGKAVS